MKSTHSLVNFAIIDIFSQKIRFKCSETRELGPTKTELENYFLFVTKNSVQSSFPLAKFLSRKPSERLSMLGLSFT